MFKKYRSNSTNNDRQQNNGDSEINHNRRYSQPSLVRFELLHTTNHSSSVVTSDSDLSPLTTPNDHESLDTKSMLSETNTLTVDREQRLELQGNYLDNFTMYFPYLLRQHRLLEHRLLNNHNDVGSEKNLSDDATVIESNGYENSHYHRRILNEQITNFNYKRNFILVNGLLKHDLYIFPSEESFKLFKELRSNIKKDRKSSIILYDSHGNIKKISNVNKDDKVELEHGEIDTRSHIIPIDYKIKGEGLPVLKMEMPYFTMFRKAPLFIFKKYLEIPNPPEQEDSPNNTLSFETTNICVVHSKFLQRFRRFIFDFTFPDESPFKVVMFQSDLKPYADFNYKGTRFRVIGPTITNGLICKYNPHMRLLVIDDNQPSLCDNVINKKSVSLLKRNNSEYVKFDLDDFSTYINPIPESRFANDETVYNNLNQTNYVPNDLPPFGCFKDSMIYSRKNGILPKKYNEVGKVETYQVFPSSSINNNSSNPDSTYSVATDSIVICCILSTLREISIRNAGKGSNSPGFNNALVGRLANQSMTPFSI